MYKKVNYYINIDNNNNNNNNIKYINKKFIKKIS